MSIYVEPGNACNFKCVFCPESFEDYAAKAGGISRLSLEQFVMIARQIKELGKPKILNFHMLGEPFANPALTSFVALANASDLAHRTVVTSNGTLLKPAKYQSVLDSGLHYLKISIYGATQETHAARTQSKIPLSNIHKNISGFKALRDSLGLKHPFIYVKMIEQDASENAAFIETFSDCADEIQLEPVVNWNDPEEGNLSGMSGEALLGTRYFSKKKAVCPYPFYMLVIHSSLDVSVCCVDWNKKTVVGNLRDETLSQIWRGERLRQFRRAHLERRRCELEACRNCTFLHTTFDNLDGLQLCQACQGGPINMRTGICPDCGTMQKDERRLADLAPR